MASLAFASASAPRGEPARRQSRRARKTLRDSPRDSAASARKAGPRPLPKGRHLRSRPCPVRGEAEGSDTGVAQEAARRRATRRVPLAAHASVRGMAEAGRLTVGGRVVRLRAYGLGDTRGASDASPKSPPRFRRRPGRDLSQRLLGIQRGAWQVVPKIRDKDATGRPPTIPPPFWYNARVVSPVVRDRQPRFAP